MAKYVYSDSDSEEDTRPIKKTGETKRVELILKKSRKNRKKAVASAIAQGLYEDPNKMADTVAPGKVNVLVPRQKKKQKKAPNSKISNADRALKASLPDESPEPEAGRYFGIYSDCDSDPPTEPEDCDDSSQQKQGNSFPKQTSNGKDQEIKRCMSRKQIKKNKLIFIDCSSQQHFIHVIIKY